MILCHALFMSMHINKLAYGKCNQADYSAVGNDNCLLLQDLPEQQHKGKESRNNMEN